jgi:hypothetical protein
MWKCYINLNFGTGLVKGGNNFWSFLHRNSARFENCTCDRHTVGSKKFNFNFKGFLGLSYSWHLSQYLFQQKMSFQLKLVECNRAFRIFVHLECISGSGLYLTLSMAAFIRLFTVATSWSILSLRPRFSLHFYRCKLQWTLLSILMVGTNIFVVSLWSNQPMRRNSSIIYWYIPILSQHVSAIHCYHQGVVLHQKLLKHICVVGVYGLQSVQRDQLSTKSLSRIPQHLVTLDKL